MKQHHSRFLAFVEAIRPTIKEVTPEEVMNKIEKKESFCLIDVREYDEWAAGHIPGALFLSKGIIERDIEKFVQDHETPIVLYCGGGYRSAIATDSLKKMGYTCVESMIGGFRGWVESGYPVDHPELHP